MWSVPFVFVFSFMFGLVESQSDVVDVNDLYELIQNKNNARIEMRLLKSQIQILDEKIDAKEEKLNQKLNGINRRLETMENAIEEIAGAQNSNGQKTKGKTGNTDSIQNALAIMKRSFENEKKFTRKLLSLITSIGDTFRDRTRSGNDKTSSGNPSPRQNGTLTNSEQMRNLDEKVGSLLVRQVVTQASLQEARNDIEALETKLEIMFENQDDQGIQNQCEIFYEKLETQIMGIEQKQSAQEEIIQATKMSVRKVTGVSVKPKVHFYADVHDNKQQLSAGSKVIFNYIIDQSGAGYSNNTGVFTCPVTGVYLFSVVLANDNPRTTWITGLLMVDSETKANILSQNFHRYEHDQGSNLAILELYEGQKVWVEIFRNTDVDVWNNFSTFAGVLLYT